MKLEEIYFTRSNYLLYIKKEKRNSKRKINACKTFSYNETTKKKHLHSFQHQSNLKPPFIIEIKHQKRNFIPRTN